MTLHTTHTSAPYPAAVKWGEGLNLEVEFRCISSDLNW